MKERKLLFSTTNKVDEINISPLIDIVFILLIFFIVTTVFVEETGVEVQRPQAASAINLKKNSILIAITQEGKVIFGGNEVGIKGVRSVVRRLIKQENMPVIVQADKLASVDLYAKVHDEAILGGATSIHLATTKK